MTLMHKSNDYKKNFTNYAYQLDVVIPWLAGLTTHESASADLELYSSAGAYGKPGNGSGMETGNGKWKWKLEMEVGGLLAALINLCVVAGLLFVCIWSSPSLQFT